MFGLSIITNEPQNPSLDPNLSSVTLSSILAFGLFILPPPVLSFFVLSMLSSINQVYTIAVCLCCITMCVRRDAFRVVDPFSLQPFHISQTSRRLFRVVLRIHSTHWVQLTGLVPPLSWLSTRSSSLHHAATRHSFLFSLDTCRRKLWQPSFIGSVTGFHVMFDLVA